MTSWIGLNLRKSASIYSHLLPISDLLKENGTTSKYKIQIVQKYNNTDCTEIQNTKLYRNTKYKIVQKYKIQIVQKYNNTNFAYFDLNLLWLRSPDQRQDLNLSIYFYDVFM